MTYTGSINHIVLSCSDMTKSRKFYDFLMIDLMGYSLFMDQPYSVIYSKKTGEAFCISPGNKTTPHHKTNPGLHHLAFNTGTREEIDAFHSNIVSFYASHADHGHILDAPALYPQYGPDHYAVFFTDPDGIKLELAYSKER
ncbi:hypothetical protein MVEG_05320 [Podila verticillata NRRL 6337]|nr:hypothetical protein MVEG_05320 [Podila verticillata NRRL 6337]